MELDISDYRKRYSEYTIEEFCKINESVPQNFKYLLVLDFKVTCGNEEFEEFEFAEENAVVLGIYYLFITLFFFMKSCNHGIMGSNLFLFLYFYKFYIFQTTVMKKKSSNLLVL